MLPHTWATCFCFGIESRDMVLTGFNVGEWRFFLMDINKTLNSWYLY